MAVLAVATALLTATLAVAVGGRGVTSDLATLYVACAVAALFYPAMITIQVLLGQLLLGLVLMRGEGGASALLIPTLAVVVITAELLAIVARWDTPLPRDPRAELPGVITAGVMGGAVFAVVMLAAVLPGPRGFLAVGLASAACAGLATMLVRNREPRTQEGVEG